MRWSHCFSSTPHYINAAAKAMRRYPLARVGCSSCWGESTVESRRGGMLVQANLFAPTASAHGKAARVNSGMSALHPTVARASRPLHAMRTCKGSLHLCAETREASRGAAERARRLRYACTTYVFQMEGAQGDDETSTIKLWTAAQATIGALRRG